MIGIALLAADVTKAFPEDWPQWRGLNRNGRSAETDWLERWPKDGKPKTAWRFQVGKGHSAVSVSHGRVVTMGWDDSKEWVFTLDAVTGKRLWKQSYPCREIVQWSGPRATPTIQGNTVYTLGQHGVLRSWDVANGELRWTVQLKEEFEPDVDYGFTWSPLVIEGRLYLSAGKHGMALNAETGAFIWGDDGGKGACASPVPFSVQGKQGVAVISMAADRETVSLVGVDATSGDELWRSPPWREKWGATCVDLLMDGDQVFVTSAEQYVRCARFTIRWKTLHQDWANTRLASYTGGCILLDGHLYGITKAGLLKCLDWKDGSEKWSERGFGGHGTLIAAGGYLLAQTSDSGDLIVVEASPHQYREVRRFKVFTKPPATFTAPTLANGRIYCRSYEGEVVCLDLTGR